MKSGLLAAAIAAAFSVTVASAQTPTPPANSGPNNAPVNTPSTTTPGAPVAGANSFTEGQAKSRLEANGYSNVTELKKDDAGVWRGKAMKDGKAVTVSVDFQGNIVMAN